jgi:sterol desaturase/sphingolipid hydroxylase (fatty acid hydroxylase superfamily)
MPVAAHGSPLDPRPIPEGQLRREWLQSLSSILIFGIGVVVPCAMIKRDISSLNDDASAALIALEVLALVVWNEFHFYTCHRVLHTPMLRRFHLPHHRSVVTTPWATYSFHPVEAMMLGSVLIAPMIVHDFSFWSLLATPLFSLLFNSIGHSNYDFLPDADKDRWWLNGARRHHLHHVCYSGNYGFMFPFIDRWLGTALTADAAQPAIEHFLKKQISTRGNGEHA